MDGLGFDQCRTHVVGDIISLFFLVCALEKEATETAHYWHDHYRGGETVQIASSTFGQINHVRVMIEVVGHGVAETVLALAETVELYLHLMICNKGVLSASYSVTLLIDNIDKSKGVS